jgi:hypothetical protein
MVAVVGAVCSGSAGGAARCCSVRASTGPEDHIKASRAIVTLEAATASGVDLVRRSTPGPEMPSVRRLTAILAADVAGYSRLMGVDEEGTHERLKAHFGELVHPKIAVTRAWLVIPSADRAIRVGPRDPSIGFRYLMMGYGVTGTHAAACRECYSNDAHEPMGRNHSPVRDGTLS